MKIEELKPILELHAAWLKGEAQGKRANLYSANLCGANLCGANLRGANLGGANLRSANLRSADLYSADLRSADLYSADLRSADLRSADLRGANLRSADQGEILIVQIGPLGSRRDQLVLMRLADGTTDIRTGCFHGTVDEFRAAVAKTHGDNVYGREYAAALAMFAALCEARPLAQSEVQP